MGQSWGVNPLIKSNMIEMMSQKGEELTPEQQATLDAIAKEQGTTEEKPVVTPEVKPEPKPAEEVKVEAKTEQVMPDPDEEPTTEERQPKFVRLEKHLKMRDKVKELEEEIMVLKSKPATAANETKQEAVTDEIKAYAEENGYDEHQTKQLVELIEKNAYSRLEKKFADKFSQLEEVAEKAKRENDELEQENIWNKQYAELVDKFSTEKDHIESIKDHIKKLAWTKEFHQAPLTAIYAYLKEVEGMKPASRSKTVESGTGGQAKGGIDYARIISENDEQAIKNMSSEEFTGFQRYIKENNL